jgi:hypothetical protein
MATFDYCCHRLFHLKTWLSFASLGSSTARYCRSDGDYPRASDTSYWMCIESITMCTSMQPAHYESFDDRHLLLLTQFIVYILSSYRLDHTDDHITRIYGVSQSFTNAVDNKQSHWHRVKLKGKHRRQSFLTTTQTYTNYCTSTGIHNEQYTHHFSISRICDCN